MKNLLAAVGAGDIVATTILAFLVYFVIMFFIIRAIYRTHFIAVFRLRRERCIFTGKKLTNTLEKYETHKEEDKTVYKTGMHAGSVYIESTPTTIEGETVIDAKIYILKSQEFGYTIRLTESSYEKKQTAWWADADDYVTMHRHSFELVDGGNLSPKRLGKLKKIVDKASYSSKYY